MSHTPRVQPWTLLGTCAAAATLVVATACTTSKDATPVATAQMAPNAVNVTAADYTFQAPDSVPAGLELFHLVNKGPSLHHIQLVQLLEGKTVADLGAALKNPGPPPTWMKSIGGPNTPIPSGADTASAYLTLPAGNYALLCMIPDSAGMPHFAKGMVKALTVTPTTATAEAMPKADIEVHLSDYAFTVTGPVTAGMHTIHIVNDGPQTHEMLVAALAPGKSAKNLVDWVDGGMKGPPPAKPLGGASGIGAGGDQTITVQLAPGNYGLFCFVPDAKDGKEHTAHGMFKQITVS